MCGSKKTLYCKFRRAVLSAGLCFLSALIASGCSITADSVSEPSPSPALDIEIDFTPDPLTTAGRRTPLTVASRELSQDGRQVSYPFVCDSGMELLNISIKQAFIDYADELTSEALEGRIDYRTEYNNRGLLSFTMTVRGGDGEVRSVSAASFDCDTGSRIYISDCFGSGNESYRFALADRVTDKLKAQGHEVLSYLPPVDDGRLFFFNDNGLMLIYRKYEVCGAEADSPRVLLRFSEISSYLNRDALLLRMPYFD